MTTSLEALNFGRTLPLGNTISGTRDFFNLTGTSFADTTKRLFAQADAQTEDVDFASRVDAKALSFDEYKQWVTGVIDGLELSESRRNDSVAVDIADEGIRQMKNNPEYANWVLNEIRRDFAADAAVKDETNAYAVSRLSSSLDQFLNERWLSPFYDDWGSTMFSKKSSGSLWVHMSSNLQQANLIAQAQRKQAEMAAQVLLQQQTAQALLGK